MRVGVFSDIHGNIKAFEKCLDFLHLQKVDKLIFLGDAVGYLPFGAQVLNRLKENNVECIKGNHEAMLLGLLPVKEKNNEVYRLGQQKNKLNEDLIQYIQSWEDAVRLEVKGKKFYFVHGSPGNQLTGYVYPDTDLSPFRDIEYDVVVMGHTHYPFLREEYGKIFINPGSVGLPRDVSGYSCLAIINTDPFNVLHYRIKFDINDVVAGINPGEVHQATLERLKKDTGREIFGILLNN